MIPPFEPPPGFRVEAREGAVLYVAGSWREGLLGAGFGQPRRWQEALASAPPFTGRGPVARAVLADGRKVLLKRMLRGGLAGPLWFGRHLRVSRLRANLTTPSEALRRGIPAARPVAMLLAEGPPFFYRAWLGTEEIEGATDLRAWLGGSPAPGDFGEVLQAIRRAHDAGLRHPDLNLGNLLVRRRVSGTLEVFFVDLDRARLEAGPVRPRSRRAALDRLARSLEKEFRGARPPSVPPAEDWEAIYAADPGSPSKGAHERGQGDGETRPEQPPREGSGSSLRHAVLPSPAQRDHDG